MTTEEREIIDTVANALASAALLAAHARRTATIHADETVQLADAVDRAVSAIKRLQPRQE